MIDYINNMGTISKLFLVIGIWAMVLGIILVIETFLRNTYSFGAFIMVVAGIACCFIAFAFPKCATEAVESNRYEIYATNGNYVEVTQSNSKTVYTVYVANSDGTYDGKQYYSMSVAPSDEDAYIEEIITRKKWGILSEIDTEAIAYIPNF